MIKPQFPLLVFRPITSRWISLVVFLITSICLGGQSRAELEAERNLIVKEIEMAQAALDKTKKSRTKKLRELQLLEDKIQKREKLIDNLQLAVEKSQSDLSRNKQRIVQLGNHAKEVNEQYAKLLRYSYLKKLSTNKWTYLLSAKNLNDAFLRWRYMKQFENYCREKSREIHQLQVEIDNNNQAIIADQKTQKELLAKESSQISHLEEERKDKDALLREIKADEKKWRSELEKAKQEREKLNLAIENAIVSELKKRRNESTAEADKAVVLSGTFAENQGKFPWPVANGYISSDFGVQKHPTLKNVKINNNGIDIRTQPSSQVKVIHPGTIIGVTEIPGYDYMIIVQHGNFYTVYSKLLSVNVKAGQKVNTGTILGQLSAEEGVLHFEVWKNKTKQNPARWLKKK